MCNPNALVFTGEKDAYIFFDACKGDHVTLRLSRGVDVRFFDAQGQCVAQGNTAVFKQDGVYRVQLSGDGAGRCLVTIEHDARTMPFLMPGPGVLWNHGMIFPLLLAKETRHTVWLKNHPDFEARVICIKGAPNEHRISLTSGNDNTLQLNWYPKMDRPWYWMSAETNCRDEWLKADIETGGCDTRVTMTHSACLLLVQPMRPVRMGRASLRAVDEMGRDVDARFEFWVDSERVYMEDVLRDESISVALPEGNYTLRVTRGILSEAYEERVHIGEKEALCVRLKTRLTLPAGWALGEIHCHSAFEDAALFPRETMRAARANGLNFCVQTDKDVDALLRYGVHMCDKAGEFVGIAGQEIMCHELHMNVLGVDRPIDNPEADDLTRVNPDIEEKIARWIDEIHSLQARRPCTFVLNHPWHRAETMKNGQPYFRSWWVADVFRDIHLVENFDYERWFDRLNRGRRLFGAWTGDGHDSALMYPGKEGVCVYVGDDLSEAGILRAVDQGRFVSLRYPGVLIDMTAGGAHVGEEAHGAGTACVFLRGCGEVEVLELIIDGSAAQKRENFVLECGRAEETVFDIPQGARWIMARVRMKNTLWNEETHSFTPLMEAGYDAFTNPIFLA